MTEVLPDGLSAGAILTELWSATSRTPEAEAAWADVITELALALDLDEGLARVSDQDRRTAVGVVIFAVAACEEEPSVTLRKRAKMVLTPRGRGPVSDQRAVSEVWLRFAKFCE